MILDYQDPMTGQDGLVIFPDFAFTDLPDQGPGPGPVGHEVVVIRASRQTTLYITGNTNDPQNG